MSLSGFSLEKIHPVEPWLRLDAISKRAGSDQTFWSIHPAGQAYHTLQEFAGYMGWPLVQPKALPNSSKFRTVPLTRQRPGE